MQVLDVPFRILSSTRESDVDLYHCHHVDEVVGDVKHELVMTSLNYLLDAFSFWPFHVAEQRNVSHTTAACLYCYCCCCYVV